MSYWQDSSAPEALMVFAVEQYIRDLGPDPVLPAGLRLEMAPSVRHALMRNWVPPFTGLTGHAADLPVPAQIPVEVNASLDYYCWRLVIVTEDVLLSGDLRG